MALQKQPISINFSKGLDTKTDPYQVLIGNFLFLQNSVFTTSGRLTKRNGFQNITQLPNTQQTTLTTLNDNLIATGVDLYAFSEETNQWLNQGNIQPIQLSVSPLVRVSTSQESPDIAITPTGLCCLTYMDSSASYYQVSDSKTGQQIVKRTTLPSTSVNPRAFLLGSYFIVTFEVTVSLATHLQYIAIPVGNPGSPGPATDLSNDLLDLQSGYDGYVANNTLFVGYESGANSVNIVTLSKTLILSSATVIPTSNADLVSVVADTTNSSIWISFWDSVSTNGYVAAFNYSLVPVVPKTLIIATTSIREITSVAENGILSVFYENINSYAFSGGALSDFISKLTVTYSATPVVSSTTVMLRSVGLASKAFIGANGTIYMLVAYGPLGQTPASNNSNQPSYFLVDSTGAIYMRLAYSNGGGYADNQVLPSVIQIDASYYVPYLIADLLATTNASTPTGAGPNKTTGLPAGTPVNSIYTQQGINLAQFEIGDTGEFISEIAGALHITGGQLWEYDGVRPVEHGFQVWPENISVTTIATGGAITAQTYYYVFTYEWTDNAGNLHRSASSIPFPIVTSGAVSTNTIYVPTLRLTYKLPPNPVRLVGYRWSTAQQEYYEFTSITMPVLNTNGTTSTWTDGTNTDTSSTGLDYTTIVDTLPDSSILGNTLLYTTGGVIEDIAAPAAIASALFKNRLFLIDAEDQNLLWFSKQVIENTPVEMSDLLTLYVAPTSGAQGSTGPMTALSAMDDKLIIFKKDAIYYLTGTGPDNTGANNDFTDPIFITSTVGCANPSSIVLMPNGLMFQSDKGIWLLGRDLSTNYIGAAVEAFNSQTVLSATAIPATNQVRFILNNNLTLMYDYYFNQWATHTNINAISATLYQGAHTYLNSYGQIFQELQNSYLDGSVPVLMSLTTSWINIGGLQGFERFYFGFLLGTYLSPFKLNVNLAYNYNASAIQSIVVTPDNFEAPWGGEALWGSGAPWGGPGNVFSARLFPSTHKCESFQVSIQENYDASFGVAPGAGLTLSGLSLIVGIKKGYRTQKASRSFG